MQIGSWRMYQAYLTRRGRVARAKTRNVVDRGVFIAKTIRSTRAISHKGEQHGAEKTTNGTETARDIATRAMAIGYKPQCATCDKMHIVISNALGMDDSYEYVGHRLRILLPTVW